MAIGFLWGSEFAIKEKFCLAVTVIRVLVGLQVYVRFCCLRRMAGRTATTSGIVSPAQRHSTCSTLPSRGPQGVFTQTLI